MTRKQVAGFHPQNDNRLLEVDYDTSGNQIASSNAAAIDELFGYTGRDWDSDVGLQYNRARWYDPSTGRWMSQDPIGFTGGDVNLYRYVGNSTTNATDPSGESIIGKSAKAAVKRSVMSRLKGNLKKHLLDRLVQIHHVVPDHFFNADFHGAFLKEIGLYKNQLRNLIPLPTRAGKDARIGKGRSVHDGCHIDEYFNSIDDQLQSLSDAFDAGKITREEAKQSVLDLQARLRKGLRNGEIPLHHFHDKYLSLALIGMSPSEMQALAEDLAELASKQMEKALDTHLGSYMRCQGYTGKEGVMGWIGFIGDLANPLDDIAMIQDLQTLMF